jgi:DNA/RNA-binding domain of Phe-tRNA-synthetase-like protein
LEIDRTLLDKYPGLSVQEFVVSVNIQNISSELETFKKTKQEEIRRKVISPDSIRDLPVIRAYRDFYWKVGIDPTKTRPAGEALLRRIIGGRDLPTINTLVDSYNIASAETMISIAAFDQAKVDSGALLMRVSRKGELFSGIGMNHPLTLEGVEVVIEDLSSKSLVAVYPYRDAEASKVTLETTKVLFMMCGVSGIASESLRDAEARTREYVAAFCSQLE